MVRLYVESNPLLIEDALDQLIENAETISDRETKTKYIKLGAGFDIETSRIEVESNPLGLNAVSYCYHWQLGLHDLCIMGRTLNAMSDFFYMLIDKINIYHPKAKLLVFDANLGYEWQFCKHYWKDLEITKIFAKEERDPLVVELSNTIVLREVIGLFGSSLAQIAKNYTDITKLKGDLDYSKVRTHLTEMTEKEIGYCERDVEILVQLAEKWIYTHYMGKNPRMPLTKTGIVRDAIKREYGKKLKQVRQQIASWMPERELYEMFRTMLFKGGISGSNILLSGETIHGAKGADITSDYPYQMLTKKFPIGGVTECKADRFMTDDKPYIVWIRFHKFKSRSSHALMSAHKLMNKIEVKNDENTVLDNNRIQYTEHAEFLFNEVEYKAMKRAYKWEHETIKKCWVFEDGYDFLPREIRTVCIAQYMKKQQLKLDGKDDTLEYREAKEFVNSIYGMMCTALYLEEFVFDEEQCMIESDMSSKTYEECCKYLFLSPYWGFWITSYARSMLIDVITKFPRIILQYDTDSVYYKTGVDSIPLEKYLEEENRKMRMRNDILFIGNELMKDLGTWTFTGELRRFKGLGSKRYMYEYEKDGKREIKVVVSGCRKNPETKVSSVVEQCEFNNRRDGTSIDVFDFFNNGMYIDKQHSHKLSSRYIDTNCGIDSTDGYLEIPSCLVLEPTDFTMKMANSWINPHLSLMIAGQRFINNNTVERKIYDLWKELKSSISTMTQPSELLTTGTLLLKSTESSASPKNTT